MIYKLLPSVINKEFLFHVNFGKYFGKCKTPLFTNTTNLQQNLYKYIKILRLHFRNHSNLKNKITVKGSSSSKSSPTRFG